MGRTLINHDRFPHSTSKNMMKFYLEMSMIWKNSTGPSWDNFPNNNYFLITTGTDGILCTPMPLLYNRSTKKFVVIKYSYNSKRVGIEHSISGVKATAPLFQNGRCCRNTNNNKIY